MIMKLVSTVVLAALLTREADGNVFNNGQNKVYLCHKDKPGRYHTIQVSVAAEPAHLNHGDVSGLCSDVCQDLCSGAFEVSQDGQECQCLDGPGGETCSNKASYSVQSYARYDTLILPDAFDDSNVAWLVAFGSQITKFDFILPFVDSAEASAQQALVEAIETQSIDISSLVESKLIVPDAIVSSSCTTKPSVTVTIPRTVTGICFGGICRPALCPLGPEFMTNKLDNFVPGNVQLFFGERIDCQITPPSGWSQFVSDNFNADASSPTAEFWFYPDGDGDGASNIVEFYGIPIGTFYSDVVVGSEGPFPTDPSDQDTDNDLFPDGYELFYGQDPTISQSVSIDSDADGLTNFDELILRTNPFMADSDSDGVNDFIENSDGTSSFDDTDFLASIRRRRLGRNLQEPDPCDDQTVNITLTVGDPSGSNSERYTMTVGDVEHQATQFGVVRTATYAFTAGTYTVKVQHVDSNLNTPDYDYTASITWTASPAWTITLSDPQSLLGSWFISTSDRTIGKSATLSIVQADGICDYATCVECRGDSDCYWDLDTKACKKDCRVFGSFRNEDPADCPCEKCKAWAEAEREDLSWIDSLPQCPCTVTYSGNNNENYAPGEWDEDSFCNPEADCSVNHPGAYGCIRQYVGDYGNQCCYTQGGSYISSGAGAGTPDKAGSSWSLTHYFEDKVTYDNCCIKCEIPSVCFEYIGGDGVTGARQDTRGCA